MSARYTVTVRPAGATVPSASSLLNDIAPLQALAARTDAAPLSTTGQPFSWCFPAGALATSDAAAALGEEKRLPFRGDLIVEAWPIADTPTLLGPSDPHS